MEANWRATGRASAIARSVSLAAGRRGVGVAAVIRICGVMNSDSKDKH